MEEKKSPADEAGALGSNEAARLLDDRVSENVREINAAVDSHEQQPLPLEDEWFSSIDGLRAYSDDYGAAWYLVAEDRDMEYILVTCTSRDRLLHTAINIARVLQVQLCVYSTQYVPPCVARPEMM